MTEPTPVQQLTPQVRELLAAIRDALDLPLPALGQVGGYDARHQIIAARAAAVHTAATVALRMDTPSLPVLTESVRDGIDRHPVTYTPWVPEAAADGGERL